MTTRRGLFGLFAGAAALGVAAGAPAAAQPSPKKDECPYKWLGNHVEPGDGAPGIMWRGEWEPGVTYSVGDGVSRYGATYLCAGRLSNTDSRGVWHGISRGFAS